jgi:3-methyladenine DNA glycosylase AlkD
MYQEIIEELHSLADPVFAKWLSPFLGNPKDDVILGIRVPKLRRIAKRVYKFIDNETVSNLLNNDYHEARELALFIMILKSKYEPQTMCDIYLSNIKRINNWDLIDYTAPHIIAPVLSKGELKRLANDKLMWINRIAMVSTIYYIKQNDFDLTIEFAEKFLNHPHHLMHKAVGWMLREVGKRNLDLLEQFLFKYEKQMPAVMKSYAKEVYKKR